MRCFKNARVMLVIVMAVFGTLGLFVRNITVSVATLRYYFAPVIVTAACPILLNKFIRGAAGILSYIDPLVAITQTAAGFGFLLPSGPAVPYKTSAKENREVLQRSTSRLFCGFGGQAVPQTPDQRVEKMWNVSCEAERGEMC